MKDFERISKSSVFRDFIDVEKQEMELLGSLLMNVKA